MDGHCIVERVNDPLPGLYNGFLISGTEFRNDSAIRYMFYANGHLPIGGTKRFAIPRIPKAAVDTVKTGVPVTPMMNVTYLVEYGIPGDTGIHGP